MINVLYRSNIIIISVHKTKPHDEKYKTVEIHILIVNNRMVYIPKNIHSDNYG